MEVVCALEYGPGGMCAMCAAWRVPDDNHVPPYGTVSDGTGHNPDCDVAAAVASVEKLEALARTTSRGSGVAAELRALLNGDAS